MTMPEREMTLNEAMTNAKAMAHHFKPFEKLEDVLRTAKHAEGRTAQAKKDLAKVEEQISKAVSAEALRRAGVDKKLEDAKSRDEKLRAELMQTRASMGKERTKLVLEHDVFITNLKHTTSIMKEGFESEKAEKKKYLTKLEKQIDRAETKIAALKKQFA